ncbi:hypothetical protein ATY75_24460 [Rhizobium sp. N122]|nr:hypothetical protein ATY75_24460 [Rhizobium sp. N122]
MFTLTKATTVEQIQAERMRDGYSGQARAGRRVGERKRQEARRLEEFQQSAAGFGSEIAQRRQ